MIYLLALASLCWIWVRHQVGVQDRALAIGVSFALANLLLLLLANWLFEVRWVLLSAAVPAACLYRWGERVPALEQGLSRAQWVVMAGLTLLVFGYTNLCQNLWLDDDYWIHVALQGLLARDGLPVLHPFFAEITMSGHYGRDLLIATISRLSGASLFSVSFWHITACQLSSLWLVFGMFRRACSPWTGVLAAGLVFFGIHAGGRAGLLDTYQNNNSLVHLVFLALIYLVVLVFERGSAARVVTCAVGLGVYGIIYETHFGLLGLVVLALLLTTRRFEFAWLGVLALLVCSVQGGPLTKLIQDRLYPDERVLTPGELNQHQVVRLTFPKKELFQIQLARGGYQRLSCAYLCLPDLGPVTRIAPGTPYRPLWSWDVLKIHWLATLLAPLSFWLLWRGRHERPAAAVLGSVFWGLGLTAFLVPGLVHFGPIYEFEYFRWQFAAGLGFAAALAPAFFIGCQPCSRSTRVGLALALLLSTSLAVPGVFIPRALDEWNTSGEWVDPIKPRSTRDWILSHSDNLAGFNYFDLLAASELRRFSRPGERLLVNAPAERPFDIQFESTLAWLSGIRSVGHSLPWADEPVGTPPFHRSAPARVFWRFPSFQLLAQLRVNWVLVRAFGTGANEVRRWLDETDVSGRSALKWRDGDYRLYRVDTAGLERFTQVAAEKSPVLFPGVAEAPTLKGIKAGELVDWKELAGVDPRGLVWAWGFLETGAAADRVDLHEVVSWSGGPSALVTPPSAGSYELVFFQVVGHQLLPTGQVLQVVVEERR